MTAIDSFVVKVGLASSSRSRDTKTEVEFVTSELRLKQGSTILDLPCGNGRHSLLLARMGYRVMGVDLSSTCIRAARNNGQHRNLRYERIDLSSIVTLGQKFDSVISLLSCIGYFANDNEN